MSELQISIIIAGSECPAQIRACLDSVLAQTLKPCEVLIVCSAEDPNRAELGQSTEIDSIRLRTLSHNELPSLAADLNTALPAARGTYVSFIQSPCQWHPETLARLAGTLGNHRWAFGTEGEAQADPALQSLIERGYLAGQVLFPTASGDALVPFDPAIGTLVTWDILLGLALDGAGSGVSTGSSPAFGSAPTAIEAAAQVLRKHAPAAARQCNVFTRAARAALHAFSDDSARVERAARSLALPYLEKSAKPGRDLAFLISLPRSGSSLLQRILAGHPDIHTLPEPWIMLNPCYGHRSAGIDGDYEPALAAQAVNGFLANTGGADLYNDAARALGNRLYAAALKGSGKRIFLDKTPRYYHILPELQAIYPGARFIFLLRHPLAALRSALGTWFDDDPAAFIENKNAIDLFEGSIRIYDALQNLGANATCIRYEELVADPERAVRALCDELEIAYFDGMVDYGTLDFPESKFGDRDTIEQFARPVAEFADGWRDRYADPALADLGRTLLERLGPDVMSGLGYDLEDAYRIVGMGTTGTVERDLSADELTHAGEMHYANGDFDKAREAFERALVKEPNFATAHNNLGVLHATAGRAEEAIPLFQRAIECEPSHRDAMINLIESTIAADCLAESLGSLARYLRAVPADTEIADYARQITETIESAAQSECGEPEAVEVATVAGLPRAPIVLVPGELPRISIVTPSYNQGDFLEACIDSILAQNYPNLEYIIMDGGSTDRSVPIIKRYAKYLTHWQSAPDDGQYAAIEAGLKRSTGDIMGWLNSDDKYHPDALWKVAYAFATRPQVEWLTGLYTFWDQHGTLTGVLDPVYWPQHKQLDPNDRTTIQQESTFWRRSLWDKAGGRLATELYYAGDWDLWTRFFAHASLHTLEWTLGGYRYHEGQKVGTDSSGYTAEAEVLRKQEVERLQVMNIAPRAEIPAPIRFDDPALLELDEWRRASLPAERYERKAKKRTNKGKGNGKSNGTPSIEIVTSLNRGVDDEAFVVGTWLDAGWRVLSVNGAQVADALKAVHPRVSFEASDDVAPLRDDDDAVRFRAMLAAASRSSADFVGIISPNVFFDGCDKLARDLGSDRSSGLCYGHKLAVNSVNVLDGMVDGYGYIFARPRYLGAFNSGELTFGQDWWAYWLLMTALANGFPVRRIEERHAFWIKKPLHARLDEQLLSTRACISSVLAQYLPAEFRTIPSLKLSFDIETADFETFARSFVGSRAA